LKIEIFGNLQSSIVVGIHEGKILGMAELATSLGQD